MPDYQLLIFDWDGTLVDSIARIVESMRVAAEVSGLPWRDDAAIKGIIGLGLPEAIATLYPELEDSRCIDAFRRRYGEHYGALESQPSPLFEGVAEALEAFREEGYRLAVATGKSRRGLDQVLAGRGWLDYFDVTRCADETASKPDPRMLQEILAHCGVVAERALMVGDSPFDLRMAHRAGMDSVAVGYGAQPLAELLKESPKLAIERFEELRHWLGADLSRQSREVETYV
ncbi:HAD-IA family hydrolase [Metapseudomonas lalkuanensis]|uniref:HAD-IA family hydrolase n=1 Tax=Metapseudomonas lalkuanensis TaxID=2604832 RepID=A0A5J6QNF0_9GAMM|nr:HAD-IA family hydrolase [Pseudomonas lalkuanensis]QEY63973.1 HAD-IA family hydrolase [Pseudomonas lalkuanensis]UCO96582.1 HAD-IA family hydrolase [Pseudomonas lalkuanensis]